MAVITFEDISPVPDSVDVLTTADISMKVIDNPTGPGVAVKSMNVFVDGIPVYDGGTFDVIELDDTTWINGFVAGFDGPSSAVTDLLPGQNGVEIVLDPDFDLEDGVLHQVAITVSDKAGNTFQTSFAFTTVDLSPPELVDQSPAPSEDGVLQSTDVVLSLTDNLKGVDLEMVQLSVDGALAYDGSVVTHGDPGTWQSGFQVGYTGSNSLVSENEEAKGFDFVIDPNADFPTPYDEVTIQVVASDLATPPNNLSTSYVFFVSETGRLHKVRVFADPRVVQQNIGVGTAGTGDVIPGTLSFELQSQVVPSTVSVRRGGTGTPGSGVEVATDDGLGVIAGVGVSGTIDYGTGAISVQEDATQVWNTGETVDVDYGKESRVVGGVCTRVMPTGEVYSSSDPNHFETFASEIQLDGGREFIEVTMRPGIDVPVDTDLDIEMVIGDPSSPIFTERLTYDGVGKGTKFIS